MARRYRIAFPPPSATFLHKTTGSPPTERGRSTRRGLWSLLGPHVAARNDRGAGALFRLRASVPSACSERAFSEIAPAWCLASPAHDPGPAGEPDSPRRNVAKRRKCNPVTAPRRGAASSRSGDRRSRDSIPARRVRLPRRRTARRPPARAPLIPARSAGKPRPAVCLSARGPARRSRPRTRRSGVRRRRALL